MCWCDALEDMRDALDGAYQRGEIGHGLLMCLLDLVDKAERECERLEERMRVDRYTHAHTVGEFYDLMAENQRVKGFVREVYTGICRAYLEGRPLEPYQYERAMRELGTEADA